MYASQQHASANILFKNPYYVHGLQVAFPGAYRCVCVRLKLSHLAVAAIVKVCG